MNKIRRKAIEDIWGKISELKDMIEIIKDEEEEAKDNMPENLWGSARYEAMEETVYSLEDAIDNLETVCDTLSEIVEG